MSNKLTDKFQDSTHVLPILGVLKGICPLGLDKFAKNFGIKYQFSSIVVPILLWSRQFTRWAI